MLGVFVATGFVIGGLGIWAAILTPDAPAPRPGQAASRAAAVPEATPQPRELPADITKMVGELASRAESEPENVDLWLHLGEVYYRTSQFDPSYRPKAISAFDHVLERDPKRAEALRGTGNVYYDQQDAKNAIIFFERFLEAQPGDPGVRTDLATMYLSSGEHDRALALYRDVIAEHPDFMQAHYNLAAALHGDGETEAALAELRIARSLATDDALRERIDALIARLSGSGTTAPITAGTETSPHAAPASDDGARSPYQTAVEAAFRNHEIMGPRIVSIEWTGPGTTRVSMRSFPMDAMPPMVREKFETRLRDAMAEAAAAHPIDGDRSVTLVDADAGRVMTTVTP